MKIAKRCRVGGRARGEERGGRRYNDERGREESGCGYVWMATVVMVPAALMSQRWIWVRRHLFLGVFWGSTGSWFTFAERRVGWESEARGTDSVTVEQWGSLLVRYDLFDVGT